MTAIPQHIEALALGNEIRRGVRTFIRETHALPAREAAQVVADVFEFDYQDRILGAARVRRLLDAVPLVHEKSIDRLLALASCANSPDKRLRELTARQRTIFAVQLRLWDGHGVRDEVV